MALKTLLIDDSTMMRKMVMRALRQSDVDVGETFEAANGEEGLAALREHSPDLVLCDWNMPVLSGLEFLEEARKFSTVPVIMITTEVTKERLSQAMGAGASGYVTKPFTSERLGTAIARVMDFLRKVQ